MNIIYIHKNPINAGICSKIQDYYYSEYIKKLGRLLLEIRQKCGISLREMPNIFNINKDKLNKYIHKIIDNG